MVAEHSVCERSISLSGVGISLGALGVAFPQLLHASTEIAAGD